MSTNVEDKAAKSKKNTVKVGGEFGGIAGIVIVGGVVAVGIAAGAIAYLRKRQANSNRTRPHKDENQYDETRQISCQKSGEICSYPNPNEYFRGEEAELTAPGSENTEETEPVVEIVESLSDLDISPDWKDMNKSKEEESPRSHFSRKTSITSTSSDSEDFSEISTNNYIRDSEINSSQMNLKEGKFYFIPIEETAGKEACSHLRECDPDDEVHISSGKQSMDSKIEYEESINSCDGLEEECEEVGRFVELGGSLGEQVGEQKLAVFDGWEGIKEAGQCILDCTQAYGTVMSTVIDNGNRKHNRVGLEEDGGSLCIEQVHESLKGFNAKVSENLQRKDAAYKEIGSMQNYETLEEARCLEEKESQLQNFDSEQDITLFKEEHLEETIGLSEGLNCHKEEHSQDAIDSNVEQCLQERINSEEDLEDCMVDAIHKDKQCQYETVDSRDFKDTDYKGDASPCNENGQHGELKESEEFFCHSPKTEESQQEPVTVKELEGAEFDADDHQDGPQNDIIVANEEMLLCKEQCLREEKLGLNVLYCSQERTDSEDLEDFKDDVAQKGETNQCGTVDSSYFEGLDCMVDEVNKGEQCQNQKVDSRDFEDLDYKGGASHSDESSQYGKFKESEEKNNHTPIKEESQEEPVACKEFEGKQIHVHYHQDGPQNNIVSANEEMLLCKEQCLQEEKFELNVEHFSQERTDSGSDNCKVNVAHKGEPYQCRTNDSSYFEDLDYKVEVCHSDEAQHEELDDLKENFHRIIEQSSSETNQSKETECGETDMLVHQDEQNEIVFNEQFVQEEEFESNVDLCLQERPESEELEDSKVDITHKGEQYHDETVDSKHLGTTSHHDEIYRHRELEDSEENLSPIKKQCRNETAQYEELECADVDLHVHQDGHKNEIFVADKELLLCKEQCLPEKKFESNIEQCLQERTDSEEELENHVVDLGNNGKQLFETVDSSDFESSDYKEGVSYWDEKGQNEEVQEIEENFDHIKEKIQQETVKEIECVANNVHIHQDVQQYSVVHANEKVLPCKEQCPQEENIKYNVGNSPQERTELVDLVNNGKQLEFETVDSSDFESSDYKEGVSYWDEKGQNEEVQELEENFDHIKEQYQQETVKEIECVANNVHIHQDVQQNSVVHANEKALPCKEQCPQEENIEDNVENSPQERTELEEFKNCKINEAHNGEQYQYEEIDSKDIETFDHKECEGHIDENCHDNEIVDSERHFCPSKEQFQEETIKDGNQNQIVAAYEQVLLSKEQCLNEKIFESHSEQWQQEMAGSEELENSKVDVAHEGKQGHLEAIDSREFVALGEGASHENGSCQYGVINSKDFEGFDEGASHKNGSFQYGAAGTSEFEDSKGSVSFAKEQSESVRADSKEDIDQDVSSENILLLREENPKQSLETTEDMSDMEVQTESVRADSKEDVDQDVISDNILLFREENPKQSLETTEDMSDMEVQCEKCTIDSNEKADKEGDALICKEEYQEELLDSIDSQTFVQDAHVDSQGREEVICKVEELDTIEEIMPIIQEHSQKATADSIDKLVSVEDLSLKNKKYQRKMSESEVLDNPHISGEECKENTVDLEELEQSENVHFSKEQYQQNIVDPEETIDLENVIEYKQCQSVDINGKESEYSIGNALILKGLSPNEIAEPKDPNNEDPQTLPKEVDAKESEYSSGDTLCLMEKYQQETIDKAASEDYRQDPEIFPELEGVHTNDSENSSTHTHCHNGEKEVNQDMSTTVVPESCKLVGVSKEIQVHNESTHNETDTDMKSESKAVANPSSVTKRLKNGCDSSQSPQLDSSAEEGKFHLAQFPRHLTFRIRAIVCLFAFFAFLFLFASKLARISTSAYAI